jgi:acyl-CoA synthetase (AMP-forming)/AMP-acid ligase II
MTDRLSTDILRSLDQRAELPQITVLGRQGRANHYTGRQLLSEARRRLAQWEIRFGPGPKVLIASLPAGESFLFPMLASLIGDCTLVPVPTPRPSDMPGRLRHMAQTCGATAILCTSRHRKAIEMQLRSEDGTLPWPVVVEDDPVAPVPVAVSPPSVTVPLIQHTSGSTWFPKAVPIRAAQIRENCARIQCLWGMNAETTMVNWLPHYHDMGLIGGIVYPLLSGGRSVQMSPLAMIRRPLAWLRAVSEYRATFSGGPAFAFQECLNRIQEEECGDLDLSSWRRAYCGAEPVPAGLLERFRQRFAPCGLAPEAVFSCYGLAEYTLFAAGGPGGDSPEAPVPQGVATEPCLLRESTRQRIRITDPQTAGEMQDGQQGEIWLSGASASAEYLGLPVETAETFGHEADGTLWMRTGDLGVISGRYLYVTGRQKDIIIVNGRNVAAAEIEWVAGQVDSALNPFAAAAFAPAAALGGHANLFIELLPKPAKLENPPRVIEQIRSTVAGTHSVLLDEIRILPRGFLPRTSSGKIRRQQVALSYEEGVPAAEQELLR